MVAHRTVLAMQDDRRVRLLDLDPHLAAELDEDDRLAARASLVAPLLSLKRGPWDPSTTAHPGGDSLGLLLVDGLLLRDVALAQSTGAELLAAGDVIRPWQHIGAGAPLVSEVKWRALSPCSLVLLDQRLVGAMSAWPAITVELVARGVARAQTLAVALAISCVTGLEMRLLALLWHLADRFGRVRPEGIVIPLPLTHEVVGRLAGASRPSVSTALKRLEREGAISKHPDGGFMLHGDPPDLARAGERRRASRLSRQSAAR